MHTLISARALTMLAAMLFTMMSPSVHAGPIGGDDQKLTDQNLNYIKSNDIKRVVIPSFTVIFHTKANKSEQSKRGLFSSNKSNAKSAMFVEWKNPDLNLLQKIADDAYRVFEKSLIASGMEVIPMKQVIGSETYRKINGSTTAVVDEKMISFAPTGMKVYDPGGKIDPNGSFFLGLANMNGSLEGAVAKAVLGNLDGVATARVTVNVQFGTFETDASTVIGDYDIASAKVEFVPVFTIATSSPTVTPIVTGIEIFSNFESAKLPNGTEFSMPRDISRVQLKSPHFGDKPICAIREVTTTSEKAGVGVANAIGMLLSLGGGVGGSLAAGSYEADVNGDAFGSEAGVQIGKLASLIGDRLKAAR
jgi:hypothetical protein